MFKKKCSDCGQKIEKGFNYCPYCGAGFRGSESGYGMLGLDDFGGEIRQEQKLPFGMERIMGSLIKQLEKQMGSMDFEGGQGMPKGFSVRISRGGPLGGRREMVGGRSEKQAVVVEDVSEAEIERRMSLPKVEGSSRVRRLADSIVYEIETPGVRRKGDVVVTRLETGLEIKAYSEDKCYVKFIPLKVELIGWNVEREKVFVEIRG